MADGIIKVLGLDTSLRCSGVAVVAAKGNQFKASIYGAIKNPPTLSRSECLRRIYERVSEVIISEQPDVAAIEGVFHAKSIGVAFALGEARGAAITACANHGIPLFEYAPRSVKKAVVGSGAASKDQVCHMVKKILSLDELPDSDPADAMALAICHLQQSNGPLAIDIKQL